MNDDMMVGDVGDSGMSRVVFGELLTVYDYNYLCLSSDVLGEVVECLW
jgi:hypothetical protein